MFGVALAVAAMVSVTVPEPGAAMLLDESVAVTPLGAPETASVSAPVKPVCAFVVIVTGVELGRFAVIVDWLVESVNVGAAITNGRLSVALCPALVPVMFSE